MEEQGCINQGPLADAPLYVTVQQAADIAGVSYDQMSAWVNDEYDPLPHILVGARKKLIRTSALPGYLMGKERRTGCKA